MLREIRVGAPPVLNGQPVEFLAMRANIAGATTSPATATTAATTPEAAEEAVLVPMGAGTLLLFVGVATGLGLYLIGVPAAWAIGLVAGLAEFVPYLGILVAGIPAIILGFGQGTDTGLWTVGVLIAVQQLQGNLGMPLLQNKMVDLPPAVTIFGIIAAGILFGVAGVLLATPLTIVVLVLVRRLYLHEDKHEVLGSGDAPPVPPPSKYAL